MTTTALHSGLPESAKSILDGYSLEVTAKDVPALLAEAARIVPASIIAIPYLPSETDQARLTAAQAVRRLGFEPMLHVSARRVSSVAELADLVQRAVSEASVAHCLVIAGDAATPLGPFFDSLSLLETGILERAGIQVVGVAGHPEGHSIMSTAQQWEVLERKCQSIVSRGMQPLIFTQFVFDAEIVLSWLQALRERGIAYPVRVGVPGPAGVAVLARYAAMCGVGATASMLSKYGISIRKLLGTAGPNHFVDHLQAGLTDAHGVIGLHFFPFGGIAQSVEWIEHYRSGTQA